jgi:hypothetical protein
VNIGWDWGGDWSRPLGPITLRAYFFGTRSAPFFAEAETIASEDAAISVASPEFARIRKESDELDYNLDPERDFNLANWATRTPWQTHPAAVYRQN